MLTGGLAECILINMEYTFIFKYWTTLRGIFGAQKVNSNIVTDFLNKFILILAQYDLKTVFQTQVMSLKKAEL